MHFQAPLRAKAVTVDLPVLLSANKHATYLSRFAQATDEFYVCVFDLYGRFRELAVVSRRRGKIGICDNGKTLVISDGYRATTINSADGEVIISKWQLGTEPATDVAFDSDGHVFSLHETFDNSEMCVKFRVRVLVVRLRSQLIATWVLGWL